jgi:oligopeptidase A
MTQYIHNDNPLLDYNPSDYLPIFSKIQPSLHIVPAITKLADELDISFKIFENKISSKKVLTFEEVFDEMERIQYPLSRAWSIVNHLDGVTNSDELTEAKSNVQSRVVETFMQFGQSDVIHKAMKSLNGIVDDPTEKLIISRSLRSMKHNGIGLEAEKKDRLKDMCTRLRKLGTIFSKNVIESSKSYKKVIKSTDIDSDKIKSIPEFALQMWSNANQTVDSNNIVHDSTNCTESWTITLDPPSLIAALKYIPDSDIRKEIFLAYITRASSGDNDNEPIINEILELRHTMATEILGYKNYTELSLASKMAKSVDEIDSKFRRLYEIAKVTAHNEMDEIHRFARELENQQDFVLKPWDHAYYSNLHKEKLFNIKEEDTKEYFALPNVLKGLFNLANRLFSVRVEQVDTLKENIDIWDKDVMFFKIYENDSIGIEHHIASFYLDPYSRIENKEDGAWMDDCVGKSRALGTMIPVAYLICNGTKPYKDNDGQYVPSLMTFTEVETLFHEFGHGLQLMLTKEVIGEVAGINGIEWDAVELPSQFMENWCYDKKTLYGDANMGIEPMAIHYRDSSIMPLEMYTSLVQQKNYGAGMEIMRQLMVSNMDLELHSNYISDKAVNTDKTIWEYQKKAAVKYSAHNSPVDQDRFLCVFSHIFDDDYAAGYYSYKWAEIMSADAFGAFEEAGLDNEDNLRETGMRFRNTILAMGGSKDPTVVYQEFRGKEFNVDSLLRHRGLGSRF